MWMHVAHLRKPVVVVFPACRRPMTAVPAPMYSHQPAHKQQAGNEVTPAMVNSVVAVGAASMYSSQPVRKPPAGNEGAEPAVDNSVDAVAVCHNEAEPDDSG